MVCSNSKSDIETPRAKHLLGDGTNVSDSSTCCTYLNVILIRDGWFQNERWLYLPNVLELIQLWISGRIELD
ncbi:hypothetical protein GWI33_020697 [Rhynchophorus ferrugineus]|uniref:Uncharacterized protein n=1 Tax=Rhynchophorus ferrugineus TaxID=354439 RepID=A0A834HQ85_RHYFE|nr:hypothetical protein GWI33_020697 [Rhynchophorus ferrugineus]